MSQSEDNPRENATRARRSSSSTTGARRCTTHGTTAPRGTSGSTSPAWTRPCWDFGPSAGAPWTRRSIARWKKPQPSPDWNSRRTCRTLRRPPPRSACSRIIRPLQPHEGDLLRGARWGRKSVAARLRRHRTVGPYAGRWPGAVGRPNSQLVRQERSWPARGQRDLLLPTDGALVHHEEKDCVAHVRASCRAGR
jgi:hypothetical protein